MPEVVLKKNHNRPLWYNLSPVNLPIPALVSILHRVSGVAIFLGMFWLLGLLDASLSSASSFESFKSTLSHPLAKLVLIGFVWAYLHHFCAGIRYLLMDIHWGMELKTTRMTSAAVLAVSLLLTLAIAVKLW